MFTSGIMSTVENQKTALFFTGRNAGKNIAMVLSKREKALDAPNTRQPE